MASTDIPDGQPTPAEEAPADGGDRPLVVVGVDGSAAADQALLFAAHEAQLRRAVLRIVTTHDLTPMTYGYAGGFDLLPLQEGMRASADRLVAAAAQTVATCTASSPVPVQTVVRQGRASHVLLEAAEGAALLVVGARGAGALTRLMMGSTSTEVLHQARVPVAVVPHQ